MNFESKTPLQEKLFALSDKTYRDFQASLMPTVEKSSIIGIRTPILRKFAADFAKTEDAESFLSDLPHTYYEENNLHALLLMEIRDISRLETALDAFLPHVDNWATCDMLSPKIFRKHPEKRLILAKKYLKSQHLYTVRFGLGMLMKYELDDTFTPEILALAASVSSDEYYIQMMQAWFFATALAKQYEAALPYLTEKKLSPWVHKKTIRKAIESYRIIPEQKTFLRTLTGRGAIQTGIL